MTSRASRPASWLGTAAALVIAHVRYWLTVAPCVRDQLRRWQGHAEDITDPILRAHAATKLRDEWGNTEVIATLCTLAPRRYRTVVVHAAVALQVMYDYLDAVTEQPVPGATCAGRQLFRSFSVALTPGEDPLDYYQYHPHRDDSGYLDALVESARTSIAELPSVATVLPIARRAAARFGEAQIRSHAVPTQGVNQLERWSTEYARAVDLDWWEWAGGAAASILNVHALLSAAADASTTPLQATQIDDAYLLSSSLTTMLDSLIDDEHDASTSAHRYIAYYPTTEAAGCRIALLARRAMAAARHLPHAAHHAMTVAGIAGYYLSDAEARDGVPRVVGERVTSELRPIVTPIIATFRVWRRIARR
jgi:tetraprenyl-beta-curcumene synthase